MRFSYQLLTALTGSLAVSVLTGCLNKTELKPGESYAKFDMNRFSVNKIVCDPFDDGDVGTIDLAQGLHAKLWYLDSTQPRYKNVSDLITNGHPSEQDLFFSDVNVPTRLFSAGFPIETGGVIQTDEGQSLIEYFAMEFEGGLRLGPDDPEGVYELALLSDDGSIMSVSESDGSYRVVVDNDGDHPTKMGCGDRLVFNNDSQYKVNFKYYQGPRYHIAMIPLWRRVTDQLQPEPNCGKEGNEMYFDYNNNSKPKKAYTDMLARGWKPLTRDNFMIPRNIGYNPCVEAPAPVVSNLQVTPHPGGSVTVSWTTDIPATGQVRFFPTKSPQSETLTASDNVLRTEHEVIIYRLTSDTNYTVQAVSISDDYGKGYSDEVTFRAL